MTPILNPYGVPFERLYVTEGCERELKKLSGLNNGKRATAADKKFQMWLYQCFKELDSKDVDFISQAPNKYERVEEFYNITYRNKEKNIRILFTVSEKRILLCAFAEKDTAADYKRALAKARKREKALLKEEKQP